MAKKEIEVEKHILVPEHRKLSEEEKIEIMKKYKAKEKQFPKIKKTDPAIRNLNPKQGDMIEIKRKIISKDEYYFYYRIVI